MQLGFREAMFTSAVRWLERLRYDVVLVAHDTQFIVNPSPFAERRLYQARGLAGAASVAPIRAAQAWWENPLTHDVRRIYVLGVRAADDPLSVQEISAQL